MKNLSAGVRVGILFILLAIGAYLVWKNIGQSAGSGGQEMWAKFRDASGLPTGSKVVVAGLRKGTVTRLAIDGRYARVYFTIDSDIPIWSSAVAFKKASSLLGENYLEIDPGDAVRQAPDGTSVQFTSLGNADLDGDLAKHIPPHKPCKDYDSDNEDKRRACREIPKSVEAVTPDQLIHRIEETMPKVDEVLDSVRDLSNDVRGIVNGPVKHMADRLDGLVEKNADKIQQIIDKANTTVANINNLTDDLRNLTHEVDPKVNKILDDLQGASAEAKVLVQTAKDELAKTGDAVRGKLDKLDGVIDNTKQITEKINSDKGTLGKLVNDPAIADNVEAITTDARGFLGTLFGLKAVVGLRSEYNFGAQGLRHYVSVELHTRPDKFYLIELEKGPRGDYPDVTLTFDPTVDPNNWVRKSVIYDRIRFTFQFAKRFGWLTLRYGLKESTGGIGADVDVHWFNRDLKLSVDAFDANWDKYPRVKITAAYEMFKHIYILGGVDELLNEPQYLPIVTGNSNVPTQFSYLRYGRDAFLGGMIRFTDEDLTALLAVGGAAVAGAAK